MSTNKEDLKNRIIYRAAYRGSKEMDILMAAFIKHIIDSLSIDELVELDNFVNMNDEKLMMIRNKEINESFEKTLKVIVDKFQSFKI